MKTRPPLLRALLLASLTIALAACGRSASKPDAAAIPEADTALMARLGDLASQRVQERFPGVALAIHQVELAPGDGRYTFRFVDVPAARVITATGKVDALTPAAFDVTDTADPLTVLVNPPAVPIDLKKLQTGPDGVVAAAVQTLGAATPRSLLLTMQDGRLVWRATVNGPKGIVSGTVVDETGRFVVDASPR